MSEHQPTLHHTGTAQIIQLFASRPKLGKKIGSRSEPVSDPQCEGDVSDTGKNYRLRRERHVEWRRADAIREYWQVSLKMGGAISRVQNFDMPEGDLHPEFKPADHWTILAKYRAAIMQQLLTPAPTTAEITWKRAAFRAGDHRFTDVKPERIERAIADDVEFLKAHPVRQSRKRDQEQ
jgi:hypothetical protein